MLGLAIISTILLGLLILLYLIAGFDLDMTILDMVIQIGIIGILALGITTIWILYKR